MPETRPLTDSELMELDAQGIDSSQYKGVPVQVLSKEEMAAQQAPQQAAQQPSAMSGPEAALATEKAHLGGQLGGGAGALGTGALLTGVGLAPFTEGTSLLPSLLGLLGIGAGAAAGSYAGQKGQESLQGPEETSKLQSGAQEAEEEHPLISSATDIVGSALASGGRLNLSNIPAALGGSREAIGKLALNALVNPAINTGIGLAAGQGMPSGGELAKQALGGALFSESWLPGHSKAPDETTTPEPLQKEGSVEGQEVQQESPFTKIGEDNNPLIHDALVKQYFNKTLNAKPDTANMPDEQGLAALSKWKYAQGTPVDEMRQQLHEKWLADQAATKDISLADVPQKQPWVQSQRQEPTEEPTQKQPPVTGEAELVSKPVAPNTAEDEVQQKQDDPQILKEVQALQEQSKVPSETAKAGDKEVRQAWDTWESHALDYGEAIANKYPATMDRWKKAGYSDQDSKMAIGKTFIEAMAKGEPLTQKMLDSLHASGKMPVEGSIDKAKSAVASYNTVREDNGDQRLANAPQLPDKEGQTPKERYDALQEQLRQHIQQGTINTPEGMAIWKQLEDLKNTNRGMPPTSESVAKSPEQQLPPLLTHQQLVDHIKTGRATAGSVLQHVANGPSEYAPLAEHLMKIVPPEKLATRVAMSAESPQMQKTSSYNPFADMIRMTQKGVQNPEEIMHEVIHAATYKNLPGEWAKVTGTRLKGALDSYLQTGPNPHVKELIHSYYEAVRQSGLEDTIFGNKAKGIEGLANFPEKLQEGHGLVGYGLGNLHEFMAMLTTDKEFQEKLNGMKSGLGDSKSLWTRIVEAVRGILGVPVKDGSLLERALKPTEHLMGEEGTNDGPLGKITTINSKQELEDYFNKVTKEKGQENASERRIISVDNRDEHSGTSEVRKASESSRSDSLPESREVNAPEEQGKVAFKQTIKAQSDLRNSLKDNFLNYIEHFESDASKEFLAKNYDKLHQLAVDNPESLKKGYSAIVGTDQFFRQLHDTISQIPDANDWKGRRSPNEVQQDIVEPKIQEWFIEHQKDFERFGRMDKAIDAYIAHRGERVTSQEKAHAPVLPKKEEELERLPTNRMGGVGKFFESAIDKIHDLPIKGAHDLGNALTRMSQVKEKLFGTLANPTIEMGNRLTPEQQARVESAGRWMRENRQEPPSSMFKSTAEMRAFASARNALKQDVMNRIQTKQPVTGYDGKLRMPTYDKFYWPTTSNPKTSNIIRQGTDLKAIGELHKEFTDYQTKVHDVKPPMAEKNWQDYKTALQGQGFANEQGSPVFNAHRRAEGIPLPPSMTRPGFVKNFSAYMQAGAADHAFFREIESNPKAASALGFKADPWGNKFNPKETNESMLGNDNVKHVMTAIKGDISGGVQGRNISKVESAATATLLGPLTEGHILASNFLKASTYMDNPVQWARSAAYAVTHMPESLTHAKENGKIQMSATKASDMWNSQLTFADRLAGLTKAVRNVYTLGDLTGKFNAALLQGMFEYQIPTRVAMAQGGDAASIRLMQHIDPDFSMKKVYSPQEMQSLASQMMGVVHGTKDARTMPAWMLGDNEISAFFKLSSWGISQTNSFMRDVYTPATEGSIKPLLLATFGATVGGYMIKQLREEAAGKDSQIPSLSDVVASGRGISGNIPAVAYSLMAAASYAGYGGMLSTIGRYPFDAAFRNTPQGATFPLDTLASDLATTVMQATTAITNDPKLNWLDLAGHVGAHLMGSSFQLGRVAMNHAINEGTVTGTLAEKKQLSDKMNELRRFYEVNGLPVDDIDASGNPYMNLEQKKFKMEQNPQEAMKMLPDLVQTIVDRYRSTPDVMMQKLEALKSNEYGTLPSPETLPLEFQRYLSYLDRLHGTGAGQAALQDYMSHKLVNEGKASAVP